jgi:hypothetical protein
MQQEEVSTSKKPSRKIWFIVSGIALVIFCLCAGVIGAIRISSDLREQQYVGKPTPIPDKVYVELRTAALHRTASELELDVDPNSNQPYGVIIDWNVGQAIPYTVTNCAF